MKEDLDSIRDQILVATLDQVPFDGWSKTALKAGTKVAGYKPAIILRAFPNGMRDLTEHFSNWAYRQMLETIEDSDFEALGVRQKIHACVKARLQACAPYHEAMLRLSSWLAMPQNSAFAARLTWKVCSDIWYLAGDRSADWNHYSKRTLLAGAYVATVMYWLSDVPDEQGDFPDTWVFLDNRLQGIVRTFGAINKFGKRISESLSGGVFRAGCAKILGTDK